MNNPYNEVYWAYSCGGITFEQMMEQLALLKEAEEIRKTVS